MSNIFFGFITLAFIITASVLILVMLELRTAIRALSEFVRAIEKSLNPVIEEAQTTLRNMSHVTDNVSAVSEELQLTLRSMRNITDNITAVTEDVKDLSGSLREVGEKAKYVSGLIDDVTASGAVKISGWRAGIRAASEVLAKGFFVKRGKQKESRT